MLQMNEKRSFGTPQKVNTRLSPQPKFFHRVSNVTSLYLGESFQYTVMASQSPWLD